MNNITLKRRGRGGGESQLRKYISQNSNFHRDNAMAEQV